MSMHVQFIFPRMKPYTHFGNEMNCVLCQDSALLHYTKPQTPYANVMNFGPNHSPDAGSIACNVDLQSRALTP